jgi:hypothetical protein
VLCLRRSIFGLLFFSQRYSGSPGGSSVISILGYEDRSVGVRETPACSAALRKVPTPRGMQDKARSGERLMLYGVRSRRLGLDEHQAGRWIDPGERIDHRLHAGMFSAQTSRTAPCDPPVMLPRWHLHPRLSGLRHLASDHVHRAAKRERNYRVHGEFHGHDVWRGRSPKMAAGARAPRAAQSHPARNAAN